MEERKERMGRMKTFLGIYEVDKGNLEYKKITCMLDTDQSVAYLSTIW